MEDWIQTIIILLVIGGSVMGPILKKLIDAATPKDDPKTPTTPPSPRDGGSEPPQKIDRPRPTPSRSERRAAESEDIPQAVPIPLLPPRRAVTSRRATPEPPPPPTVRDTPRRRTSPPLQRPTEPKAGKTERLPHLASGDERLGHLESIVEQTGGADERASEQRLHRVASSIEEAAERIHAGIDERLGHVESAAYALPTQTSGRARIPGFGRATPHAMRQAVVLREILGPPVALHPHEPPA